MLSRLDLERKVKVIAKIESQCPREQKTCLPKKFLAGIRPITGVQLISQTCYK